jgi:hypothetical protein
VVPIQKAERRLPLDNLLALRSPVHRRPEYAQSNKLGGKRQALLHKGSGPLTVNTAHPHSSLLKRTTVVPTQDAKYLGSSDRTSGSSWPRSPRTTAVIALQLSKSELEDLAPANSQPRQKAPRTLTSCTTCSVT